MWISYGNSDQLFLQILDTDLFDSNGLASLSSALVNSLISSLRRQAQKTIEIPVKNSNNNNNSDTKSSSKSRRVIERESYEETTMHVFVNYEERTNKRMIREELLKVRLDMLYWIVEQSSAEPLCRRKDGRHSQAEGWMDLPMDGQDGQTKGRQTYF